MDIRGLGYIGITAENVDEWRPYGEMLGAMVFDDSVGLRLRFDDRPYRVLVGEGAGRVGVRRVGAAGLGRARGRRHRADVRPDSPSTVDRSTSASIGESADWFEPPTREGSRSSCSTARSSITGSSCHRPASAGSRPGPKEWGTSCWAPPHSMSRSTSTPMCSASGSATTGGPETMTSSSFAVISATTASPSSRHQNRRSTTSWSRLGHSTTSATPSIVTSIGHADLDDPRQAHQRSHGVLLQPLSLGVRRRIRMRRPPRRRRDLDRHPDHQTELLGPPFPDPIAISTRSRRASAPAGSRDVNESNATHCERPRRTLSAADLRSDERAGRSPGGARAGSSPRCRARPPRRGTAAAGGSTRLRTRWFGRRCPVAERAS